MNVQAPRAGLRSLFSSPSYRRLWAIGGCVNMMRWFEVLSAALFTFDMTGSGFAVALVSAARTMPMLLLGAFSGVVSEAVSRKRVLLIGQIMTGLGSASVALLAGFGVARPWHVGVAAVIAGIVWSTDMSTRRRMLGEAVETHMVARGLALDTMSNALTRLLGPIAAGAVYQRWGITGCFGVSACVYAVAVSLVLGLRYSQTPRPLVLSQVPRDLAEAFSYARTHAIIAGVLLVTIAMNLLCYPYSSMVAPLGRQVFDVSPTLVGVLAASEPFGGFLGGMWLTSHERRIKGRVLMVGGSLLFLVCVIAMTLAPVFPLACLLLMIGGFGSCSFANMQTSLIVLHAPPQIRSRLMGLLTVGIGMGPLGVLMVGAIAGFIGPRLAIDVITSAGLVVVVLLGLWWRAREKAEELVQPLG